MLAIGLAVMPPAVALRRNPPSSATFVSDRQIQSNLIASPTSESNDTPLSANRSPAKGAAAISGKPALVSIARRVP